MSIYHMHQKTKKQLTQKTKRKNVHSPKRKIFLTQLSLTKTNQDMEPFVSLVNNRNMKKAY